MPHPISLASLTTQDLPTGPGVKINRQKEKAYYWLMIIISTVVWFLFFCSSTLMPQLAIEQQIGIVLSKIMMCCIYGLIFLCIQGLFIGNLVGNAVQVGPRQFPDIDERYKQLGAKLGMQRLPQLYIQQAGGLLNAFATRFLFRNFIVIYSDVLEMAYAEGEAAVDFILAHELGHHQCRHTGFWSQVYLLPAKFIPFLGTAYSRACEYTCDHMGAELVPGGLQPGMLALACGKKLYKRVNVEQYVAQIDENAGFWVWLHEKLSTHPNLPKRIRALQRRG